jgi:flagellar L-ring protein precursor FlgH
MKTKSLLIIFCTLIISSCSTMMDGMYRDLNRQERVYSEEDNNDAYPDQFDQYRKNTKRRTSSVYNKPGRDRQEVTTNTQKLVSPEVKRRYQDEKVALKRVTASDLTDNGNDGSLWSGSDPNSFLFATSKSKSSGDIIQINVLPKLRNEITMELKKAFPENPFEAKAKAAESTEKKPDGSPATPAPPVAAAPAEPESNAQDKISGVVVEEINREHLLIKGRKNVLFKNRKRMVEVQALVSRKDISDDDSISSDSILESNVSVVR